MSENQIPLLDCPVDYLVGDASGKLMNEYGRFPCKIMCGVYAFMVKGTARATIDITEHEFKENDILMLQPGSFLLIHEFSEDSLVYYILFSSKFIEKNTFSNRLSMIPRNVPQMIVHLTEQQAPVIRSLADLLFAASNCQPSMLTPAKMVPVFNLLNASYVEYATRHQTLPQQPQDRRSEILHEYNNLVMKHYSEWHHVSQYAAAMHLTLPHLCATIKAVSGRTAGDMITDAILTDAKAQLKITNLQVKEIALALGFENVAFFNRFFKAHTGLTPKEYRLK
ncbi:MAG: AraC family transcriptional regulator [Paludibacteraceae bacterium]|nr:AraC family transcriptional regulator [Paludibacteraceae bacterium]